MRELKIHGIYRHFKGDYIQWQIQQMTVKLKKKWLYIDVYMASGTLWVRPLDMFLSEVDHKKYPNEKQKYRFELQEIESKAVNYKN